MNGAKGEILRRSAATGAEIVDTTQQPVDRTGRTAGDPRQVDRTGRPAEDPRHDPAVRARIKWALAGITLVCLLMAAVGWAFVSWLMTLPPGSIKTH